ncbi:MAG: LEPR-XLL domain-containing protein [Phycisphaeraceae bacterium]|nr:LEPR-XLL domain-containing protein [Phycisphaeraceae bacterium]
MSTRTCPDRLDQLFEALEPRQLLAGDAMPFTLYYPEGYAHDQISEFVPITNPNNHAVSFQLIARYETGDRDQVLAEGLIPPNTRSGVTINTADRPQDRLVRKDEAYALILKSSDQVDATISHYDFGATIGQSFADEPSTYWTFTDVQKDHDTVRDFLVYYNTSDERAHITLTFIPESGENIVLHDVLGALRRGGLNIDATRSIPEGIYAVTITSDQPIVAALTHYDISMRRGFGVLGAANGGGLAGLIPAVDFQDNDRGHGNDPDGFDEDNPGRGHGNGHARRPYETTTSFNVLNTGTVPANVTFTFLSHDGTGDIENATRSVIVPAGSRVSYIFDNLDFTLDAGVGVAYESDHLVTVAAMISGPRRAAAIPAIVVAATQWGFGEGFMTRDRAGRTISENLYLFNPAAGETEVKIEFLFRDGTAFSTTRTVGPASIVDVNLDVFEGFLRHTNSRYFFGIRVTADDPIIATLDHMDRVLAGGFTTAGIPRGTVVPLSSVLQLPEPPAPVS